MRSFIISSMKSKPDPNTTTSLLRGFGGFLLALSLIFGVAWLFNRLDANAFDAGYQVEGTVVQIWEGDPPIVVIEFVDRNGRSQSWNLEGMTQSQRNQLQIDDPVVALQMRDSPSRVMLLEQVENRPSDRNGVIIAGLFLLPGLFLVRQKRPYGSPTNQSRMIGQQNHLAAGSMFLLVGLVMLMGFVAMLLETEMHLIARLLFGGFCLLIGGGMTMGALGQLWQAFRLRGNRNSEID